MNNFKLDNEPKLNSGFRIPEHYFDDFSAKVIQQLPENRTKVISVFTKKTSLIYAVAAIFIFLLMIPIIYKYNTQNNVLDQKSIEDYLTYNAGISNYELAELLDEDDIQKMKSEYKIEDASIEEILSSNSNLEDYLIN